MQLKKVTQKNSDGSSISYEFSVPPKQEIPHPGNPKGTDTVPAWLTPGEFVMNAEATRMYKPQIEAMNETGKAVQRQQGGSIPSYHAKGGEAGPCWDGYEMVGMKDKDGKQVPNCVPQYKNEGGIIDWLSSLFGGGDVPQQEAVQAASEIPPEIIPSDYNVRPLDLPPESPMVQPQAATPNAFLADKANRQTDYMSGTYDLLKNHEGYREKPYKDSRGFWTVGTGHKITDPAMIKKLDAGEEVSFTPEQLDTQLKVDTGKAIVAARNNFKDFDSYPPSLKQSLIGMNFQLGEKGTEEFEKMRSAMDAGNWEEAAKQAMDSDWAEQTPTRAKHVRDELLKMGGGNTQASTTDVPQIFANAVASDTPEGDYFPSNISDYAGGRGDYGMVGYNKDKEFYDKTIEDGFRNPDGSLVVPPKSDVPTIDPNVMVNSLNRVSPPNIYTGEQQRPHVVGEEGEFRASPETLDAIGKAESAIESALGFNPERESKGAEAEATMESQGKRSIFGSPETTQELEGMAKRIANGETDAVVEEQIEKNLPPAIDVPVPDIADKFDQEVSGTIKVKDEAADAIVKATQEQADKEFEGEFNKAMLQDAENRGREAVTGQPELLDRTMGFLEEYGITDLFDKKEIGKMAMMYIGSRVMGYSHGGSLNFAMKNYATNVQAKQTAKAKEIKDLLEGGKFEPSSIAKYEKSGDINDLVKKGQTFTPTGKTKYVLYRDPKTKKTQRLKVREVKGSDDNGIYYQLPNGQRINDLSPNLRDYKPEMYEGTPEFNTYNQQAAASHLEALNAVVDVEDAKDDDGNLVVPIHPRLAAEAGVNWARAMGLDPKDSRVQAVIRDAYTAALRENKGKELQATELEPYLTRMSIMQEEQRPQLYERMDSDGKPTGKYISPVDLASIRAMVKEETSEIMKRRSTAVTTKQIWDYAAAQWESLGPEGQKKYHKAALDGDSSGFAKYLEEQLNANKYDRIVGQSK